jgi:hypothetical protein
MGRHKNIGAKERLSVCRMPQLQAPLPDPAAAQQVSPQHRNRRKHLSRQG